MACGTAGSSRISDRIAKSPDAGESPAAVVRVDPEPWWVGAIEMVLPVLLTVGLLLPSDEDWRQVLQVVLLPLLAWYMWRYGIGGWPATRLLSIPIGWITWLGLSSGWGTDSVRADWASASIEAVMTGAFLLLCTIVVRVAPVPRLSGIGAALVAAIGWAHFRDLAEHIADFGLRIEPRLSGHGLFDNPNLAAALSCLMLVFAMHLLATGPNRFARVVALLYVPLAAVHLLFTGSRGGMVVFAVVILVYLTVSGGRTAAARFLLGAGLVLVLATGVLLLFPDAGQAVWSNLSRNVYRITIWQETWRMSLERPFLGHGYGFDERILGRFSHPHNLHLSNLLYGGLPALVLGLATLGVAAFAALSLPDRRCRALATAAMTLPIVWTITEGSVPITLPSDEWYHFWIPVALALGLALRGREHPS